MKELSKVLNSTLKVLEEHPQDLLKTRQTGLEEKNGTKNQLTVQKRENPLTDAQLTQIQSNLLQSQPLITFERKKKYGRKIIRDEFGEFVDENAVVGEHECAVVCVQIKQNEPFIKAALAKSPIEGTVRHIVRLSLHKRLGSTAEDRAILINDYAEKLRNYSEFSVYSACKYFWESNESDFAPNLGKLASVAEEIENKILTAQWKMKTKESVLLEKKKDVWKPPTEDEKRIIHELAQQALKNLAC